MKFVLFSMFLILPLAGQVVITESGSTNRQGTTVTIGEHHEAAILVRGEVRTELILPVELQTKLMRDLESAPPLNELKVSHCMKSASFGSSSYITYKGARSPDLSCPGQQDAIAATLRKDLAAIMGQVHASSSLGLRALTPRDSMGAR